MFFESNIKEILYQTWPNLLLVTVIAVSMRLIYIIKNKQKIIIYDEILKYSFIVYIMCLFYVVTFQDVSWSTSNFIPFKEILRYDFGTKLFLKNILGNMIMFIPYGFLISYFLKLKKIYSITLLTLLTSATIETTQLIIGRVFDVDDIFLNLLGGIIGFILYRILSKVKNKLPKFLNKQYIYNIIISIAMLGIIIYILKIMKVGF